MKSILFLLVAIVATLPLKAGDPFNPILVNVNDQVQAAVFVEKYEGIRENIVLPDTPVPDLSCYDDGVCIHWGNWKKAEAIVSHPKFPDCPILIGYKHRNCVDDQSVVQHHITSVSFREGDSECSELEKWLYGEGGSVSKDPDPDKLNQLYHDLYALLAKEMFIEFNEGLVQSKLDPLYCDDYTHYKVSYVKGSCTGWCVGFYKFMIWDWEISFTLSVPQNCDEKACCKVTNEFCIDRKTGKLVHQEGVTYGPEPEICDAKPISDNECYEMHNSWLLSGLLEQVRVQSCKPACDIEFLDLGGDVIVE